MLNGNDYLREVQKFTSSQYWSTGVRVTAGVMVPTLLLVQMGWLAEGMPFLWGALFASLTDAPGPIRHRRNGLLAAIGLNTLTAFTTVLLRDYDALMLVQVGVFCFVTSLLGVYGARASAVGTLALVVMLLNMVPGIVEQHALVAALLVAAGGIWYTLFSLSLYRLMPYRPAEQAIGEMLISVAGFIRARGAFYREGASIDQCFTRVMNEQITVMKNQDQTRELLFKTRQFVMDASPKSRSLMMIFLDVVDLFEHSISSYIDYNKLHTDLDGDGILNRFYGGIMQVAAALDHIGLAIQRGGSVRRNLDLVKVIDELKEALTTQQQRATATQADSLHALEKTLANIQNIVNRLERLVLYSRLQVDVDKPFASDNNGEEIAGQPIRWRALYENISLKSNDFRHAVRLTAAALVGYGVSTALSLSHTYWVLLTIVTILKPVYTVSRRRNVQRLLGTLAGAVAATAILFFIRQNPVLLGIMIISMVLSYSFMRMNYFFFVLFLTVYLVITFHFLHPVDLTLLVRERMIDTFIGSVIAAIASRFVLPAWGHEEIEDNMIDMLTANRAYFAAVWQYVTDPSIGRGNYRAKRQEAFVALTNLSDNFQRVLAEPQELRHSTHVHQFVIANHMLTGNITALSTDKLFNPTLHRDDLQQLATKIDVELDTAINELESLKPVPQPADTSAIAQQSLNPITIIYSMVRDIRLITEKIKRHKQA